MMKKLNLTFLALIHSLRAMGYCFSSPDKGISSEISQNQYCSFSKIDQLEGNWDVFADLLYWHMGEVGTIPNSTLAVTGNSGAVTTALNLNNLSFGWDFGYRVGGRVYHIGQNQWGISLYYTWFRTEAENSGSYPGFVGIPTGFPLTSTLTDASFLNLFWLFSAESFQAQWNLLYNIFDLEVDHEYSASEALSFRPYLGLRGGWIDQDINIHSTYIDVLSNNTPVPAKEELENHFWGIGPRCGLNSKWQLGTVQRHSFSLFGDLSAAFMWSFWNLSDFLIINDFAFGDLESKNRYAGSLMFQDLLGFEWRVKLNERGMMLSLRCGYESQFWFDHLQVFNAYNGRQHNPLTLQGGTFDLRFNY